MAPPPTTDALREHAEVHIASEVGALVDQVTRLNDMKDPVLERSLLESSLTHLRLLDDFFRLPAEPPPLTCQECGHEVRPAPDDITAQQYLPGWEPRPVLSSKLRGQVNAQLPHLALRRKDGVGWEIGPLAVHACDLVVAFVDELRAADRQQALWFDAAYKRATELTQPEPVRLTFMTMEASTTSSTTTVTSSPNRPPSARKH